MRIFAAAAFAVFASASGTTFAADMAAPLPVLRGALPMAEKGIDWSGFYFGGSGAYSGMSLNNNRSIGEVDSLLQRLVRGSIVETSVNAMPLVERGSSRKSRLGYGAHIGYNWTMDDAVVGIEADYNRANFESNINGDRSGQITNTATPPTTYDWYATTTKYAKITDFGSVRGRLGYAWGNMLPYVTGGIAYARASERRSAEITGRQYDAAICPPPAGCATSYPAPISENVRTKFHFGYALGAGIDVALSDNIFVRAELQHLRFSGIAGTTVQLNQAKLGAGVKF